MNFSLANYWLHKPQMVSITKLRKAIQNQVLELYFLPVVSTKDEKTVELEALLRWPIGEDQYIPPMTFIPLAEEHGLMPDLTRYVLENLCSLIKTWEASGIELNWSMNLSPKDLQDKSLLNDLKSELKNKGINESTIGIEVSHPIIRSASTEGLDFLVNVRSEGLRLVLDNYEPKSSSNELFIPDIWSCIKIDRKLVMECRSKPENIKTIKYFLENKRHNYLVCLPGVNSFFEWEKIKSLNCNYAQGFYLSPPQNPHDTQLWLQVSKWGNHTNSHVESEKLTHTNGVLV